MRTALAFGTAALLGIAIPFQAQSRPESAVSALEAVVTAREMLLNDTTSLARCPLQAALGEGWEAVASSTRLAARIASEPEACGPADLRRIIPSPHTRRLSVDSLLLGDSTGLVHLTVQRGELVYREDHHLSRPSGGTRWMVRNVTVHAAEQHYFVRPRPSPR